MEAQNGLHWKRRVVLIGKDCVLQRALLLDVLKFRVPLALSLNSTKVEFSLNMDIKYHIF